MSDRARLFSRSRLWMELTTQDFTNRDITRGIAILPVAAVEQHGPHLPAGTDSYIMDGHLERLRHALDSQPGEAEIPDVVILPTQVVGLSSEHISFPGTLTLSPETAIRAWREIGYGITRAGFRRLIIVNSHGGNSPIVDVVSRALRMEAGLLVVLTSWARLGYPDGLFEADEIRHGIHGGDIETSLMLAFRPDLVRMDEAKDFTPRSYGMEREYGLLRADRPAGFAWLAQDLHASGAMGNAQLASAEKGEQAAGHAVEQFTRLISEVARFDLTETEGRERPGFL